MSFILYLLATLLVCNSGFGAPSSPTELDLHEASLTYPKDSIGVVATPIGKPQKKSSQNTRPSTNAATAIADATEPLSEFPDDDIKYKIVKINATTGAGALLIFPYNNCQYKIVQINESAGEIPPDLFPTDTEQYKIINMNKTASGEASLMLTTNTEQYRIVRINKTVEVPSLFFPTNGSQYRSIQYNATAEHVGQSFPTDSTKFRIEKVNISCAEEPPLLFPTNSKKYKILEVNASVVPLPLEYFPTHKDDVKIVNISSELPPMLFPASNGSYKIIESNATLLRTLIHAERTANVQKTQKIESSSESKPSSKTSSSAIENFEVTTQKQKNIHMIIPMATSVEPNGKTENFNDDTEQLQPIQEVRETEPEEQFNKPTATNKMNNSDHPAQKKNFSIGSTAGILTGAFAGFALLGYIGLIIWRQKLEKKYGTRERLVTEDTYYTTNDMRHFEL